MAKVKIVASADVVDKFKRTVLAKHGKLELGAEGEQALSTNRHEGRFLQNEL